MITPTRRALAAATLFAAGALAAAACTPPTPPPPTTTTTTTVPGGSVVTVDDAVLEWAVSREADNGTFAPGQVNYWSAGESDSTEATYVATDGDVTVLKKNAAGTYVPIGSEPAVSWANRDKDGAGNVVTATNPFHLGQKVRLSGGDGTVDTSTGEATISWEGTFSINFYGTLVPFWMIDPVLSVDAAGDGTLTATMGGFASDISDPSVRVPLPATPGVVVAELPDVWASGSPSTGIVDAPTAYVGNAVTVPAGATPQAAQSPSNQAYWGAWPQSFVDFQQDTGLGSYWYTSASAVDPKKPQDPVTVTWSAT